jgi:formylglycine-generating enzyme required for sulfatase activity
MLWIAGGAFLMGSDRHYPEEAPAHKVVVSGFWMDRSTVTNGEFERPSAGGVLAGTDSCLVVTASFMPSA